MTRLSLLLESTNRRTLIGVTFKRTGHIQEGGYLLDLMISIGNLRLLWDALLEDKEVNLLYQDKFSSVCQVEAWLSQAAWSGGYLNSSPWCSSPPFPSSATSNFPISF
jgi:hypothetical protein